MPQPEKSPITTAGELLLRVRCATHQIEGARKQAVSVYDEDLRLLKQLDAQLATLETMTQPELFQPDKYLSPKIEELLSAPLAKY